MKLNPNPSPMPPPMLAEIMRKLKTITAFQNLVKLEMLNYLKYLALLKQQRVKKIIILFKHEDNTLYEC